MLIILNLILTLSLTIKLLTKNFDIAQIIQFIYKFIYKAYSKVYYTTQKNYTKNPNSNRMHRDLRLVQSYCSECRELQDLSTDFPESHFVSVSRMFERRYRHVNK